MADERNGRLVILSGPSCVGKSPLAKALARWPTYSPYNALALWHKIFSLTAESKPSIL